MPKHIHAELMVQYAADAMETDKPWERWETLEPETQKWKTHVMSPLWLTESQYRRKTVTVMPVEPLPLPVSYTINVQMPHQGGLPMQVALLFRNRAELDVWVKFFDTMPKGF